MEKHVNVLGYSLWIEDNSFQNSDELLPLNVPLYSPRVLAAYCIFISMFVGVLLYGINLVRRRNRWRGWLLTTFSGLLLFLRLFISPANGLTLGAPLLLNTLVAITLYKAEKPHFNRAIRQGAKPARGWLPLIWIMGIIALRLVVQP